MSEDKINILLDKTDILEVMYSYCDAADRNDPPGMIKHFSEDCTVNYVPDEPTWKSKDELFAHLNKFLGAVISGSHYITNPRFTFVTGDEVLLACYMYSWQRFNGYPVLADAHRFGRYEVRFIRNGGGWLITHMQLLSAGELGGLRIAEQMNRVYPPDPFPDA